MPLQDITALPEPPQRSDPPEDFITKADAFLSAFPTLRAEINTLASQLEIAAAMIAAASAYADPGLLALVGLTPAADRLPYFTGAATSALATITAAGRALLDDADASAQLTTLGVSDFIKTLLNDADAATARGTLGGVPVVGDYQPLDSDLSAISLLATTSFGRGLLTLADAAAGRTAFGAQQAWVDASLIQNGGYVVHAPVGGKSLIETWGYVDLSSNSYGSYTVPKAHEEWILPSTSQGVAPGNTSQSENAGVSSSWSGSTSTIDLYNAENFSVRLYINTKGV